MNTFTAPSSCRISVHTRHRIATVAMHDHTLIWVKHGTKTLLSASASHIFHSGDILILPQGSVWDVINDPSPEARYEATVLQFGDSALNALAELHQNGSTASRAMGCIAPALDDELLQSLHRAIDTITHPGASPALRQHRTVEVLLLLAEQGIQLEPRAALRWPDRIRRLVAQRPYADWSTEVLASTFHVSTATLRRRLAAEGIRTSDVVRETRLEIGLNLLQTTTMAIGEIAQRCGYESHSRFTAAFRKRFGFSPSELHSPENEENMSVFAQ